MKFSFTKFIFLFTTSITLIGGVLYWYVVVAGAPQLDAPKIITKNTGLIFQVKTFKSAVMGEIRNYGILLPPSYFSNPTQRYPVIFLLHGGHGTARDYEDKANFTVIIRELYRTAELPPSIIITPDGNDKRGTSPFWDPQYYDGPNGDVAKLIGSELVKVVKSRYRTLDDPRFWAIGGLSSGGWGAFNIGLRYVNNFNIFFSHTGYFIDKSGFANSPQDFIEELPEETYQRLRVYLDAGESDHQYLDATKEFHETLERLGISHQFKIFPGGHGIVGKDVGWNYWRKHLHDSLSYVGKEFKTTLTKENIQINW